MTRPFALLALVSTVCAAQPGTLIEPPPEPKPVRQSQAHLGKVIDVDMALKRCDVAAATTRLEAEPKPANASERVLEEMRRIDLLFEQPVGLAAAHARYTALASSPDLPESWLPAVARRISVLLFLMGRYGEIPEYDFENDPPLEVARLLELGRKDQAAAWIAATLAKPEPRAHDEYGRKTVEALRKMRELAAGPPPAPGAYANATIEALDSLSRIRVAASPIPLVRFAPSYPRHALRDGIEGFVEVELAIDESGITRAVQPVRAQPRGVFEAAAMEAALKFKFVPAYRGCKPAPGKGVQRVEFRLEPYEPSGLPLLE